VREEDLLKFTWIADAQISPDGRRVAFTRVVVDEAEDAYATSLWIVDAEGGAPPSPLTAGPRDSQARWAPDGTKLAFVRAREAGKPGQLHVLPMTGGEATALTSLEHGVSQPAWSPDGTKIAFMSGENPELDTPEKKKPKNEPGRIVTRPEWRMNNEGFYDWDHLDHVWVVDSADGTPPRPLTRGYFREGSPAFSRDGQHVLFLSDRRAEPWFEHEEQRPYSVPIGLAEPTAGEALVEVAALRGPIASFHETPQGGFVAVAGIVPDPMPTYVQSDLVVFEKGKGRNVTPALDLPVSEEISSDQHPPRGGGSLPFALLPNGTHALTVVSKAGAARLATIALADGKVDERTGPREEVVNGSVSRDGRRAAVVLGGHDRPGDLVVHDVETKASRTLWQPNRELLEGAKLGEVEEIRYPSFDGREIHGWIVKPPGFDPKKKYPLILEIHGGPHIAYGVGFFHEFRMLAAAGYVVLYTNPRGSTTYGREFANVIQYRYPGDDAKDLLAGVDAMIARGYVDAKRLGVTGGSGGGLLTNWLVTQTPRFAAAITQRCVSDWAGMYYSCDFTMYMPFWFRRAPWQDAKEYAERSPLTFVDQVTTPLLVLHAEEDWRTPIAQGEAMFRALKHQRKPAAMVRFPGENHELSRSGTPSRRVQNQRVIRRWFDHWLMGKEAPEFGIPLPA